MRNIYLQNAKKLISAPKANPSNMSNWIERPVNLTGSKSHFEIKVSRKVGCVLTCNEVRFASTHTELDSNEAFITKAKPFVQSKQRKKLKRIPQLDKLKLILKH